MVVFKKRANIRVGSVNAWPVPHIFLFGTAQHTIAKGEQAQMSEDGVPAGYLRCGHIQRNKACNQ
ncbi:hypothetical protein SAMN02746065_1326 [Desulfocicer vacuolatum DSM 3385]|uniref:Uncharacterized protein n=1 Tax=Desulfocicer vacuolatum DSM 3385 TaxID=1121400 RepID=A0A1W2EJD8_9BACT|nr:hypothetical protein SAMN02746065_1326 [Desulfocicer vacuolatum DSM 3385]